MGFTCERPRTRNELQKCLHLRPVAYKRVIVCLLTVRRVGLVSDNQHYTRTDLFNIVNQILFNMQDVAKNSTPSRIRRSNDHIILLCSSRLGSTHSHLRFANSKITLAVLYYENAMFRVMFVRTKRFSFSSFCMKMLVVP